MKTSQQPTSQSGADEWTCSLAAFRASLSVMPGDEEARKMMIDGIAESLRSGYIVDLGVIGTLYPAVNGKWDEQADNLSLSDMKPKVNYKAAADIAAAVKGATLQWTNEAETDENTVTDDDNTQTGGGSQTPSGELEG